MPPMRSKNSLTSNITTLYREVKGRVRYYKIALYPTLFGEYLLVREWGGVGNKRATGEKRSYFSHLEGGLTEIKKILTAKKKKGYISHY